MIPSVCFFIFLFIFSFIYCFVFIFFICGKFYSIGVYITFEYIFFYCFIFKLETQKIMQRFNLDSSNSIFPSPYIPLIRYTENGEVYYDANGNIELEKDSLERFINLNVTNEHYNFSNDQSSRFAMFCPRKFPRRRRRRRNGTKPPETNSNEN